MSAIEADKRIPGLLLVACGSIGVVELPRYLVNLSRFAAVTKVVMTRSASLIIPTSTIAHFCDEVISATSEVGDGWDHISLADWASMIAYLPASADVLAQTANGFAGTLASRIAMSADVPVIFFPNMNNKMWLARSVQRNVRRLRSDGMKVVEPVASTVYETSTRQLSPGLAMPDPVAAGKIVHSFFNPTARPRP
jgi:phosphopantothenoylcysteine decarboxylase